MVTSQTALPLFPLHGNLLPGAGITLRIFEPRYLDLLRHCSREACQCRRTASQESIVHPVIRRAGEKELHGATDFLCHAFDKRLQHTATVVIWQIATALLGFRLFGCEPILPHDQLGQLCAAKGLVTIVKRTA